MIYSETWFLECIYVTGEKYPSKTQCYNVYTVCFFSHCMKALDKPQANSASGQNDILDILTSNDTSRMNCIILFPGGRRGI